MLSVILIEQKLNMLNDFAGFLREMELEVFEASSESSAFKLLQSKNIDAVVAMEQDLVLVKKLVSAFPMVNYAIVSAQQEDDFHHTTEGYGIFMQLPTSYKESDASTMVKNLMRIKTLSMGVGEVKNDN